MKNKFALMALVIFVLAIAVIGCGGGGGGTSNPVGPAGTSERASLSGTVIFDSVPLANAQVYLYQTEKAHTVGLAKLPAIKASLMAQETITNGAYSTSTNANGVYNFADVPVGQYTLIAVKDENHQFAQTGILLGSVATVDAQLTPTGKISGKVTATIGSVVQNVSGAFVYISGTSYIALTDASGNFVINNVPSNALTTTAAYEVQVISGQGFASAKTGVRVNPGVSNDVGVFALTVPDNGYKTIAGRLVAGAGVTSAQLGGNFVLLTNTLDGNLSGTYTSSTGEFAFVVVKTGNYAVAPVNGEYSFAPAVQNFVVSALDKASQSVADIVIARQASAAAATIIGKVTTIVGGVTQNVAGAYVSVAGTSFGATTNSSGDFAISHVPANNFTASPAYEIQVNSGKGMAANKTGIKVDAAQTLDVGIFDLVLPDAGYKTVSGKFIAGAGATTADLANRFVQLTSLADRKVLGAYSNSTGDFSFVVNATASYVITAMEPGFKFNPGSQNVDVTVLDKTAQTVSDIVVIREAFSRISGTVTWGTLPAGIQFENGEIIIKNQVGTPDYIDYEPVLQNGLYTFYDVPAGSYNIVLHASKNGFANVNTVAVVVVSGTDYPNTNLTSSYVAPYISNTSVSGDVVTLMGGNYSNIAGQMTTAEANETGLPAYSSGGWSSAQCQFDLSNLPPGAYKLQLYNSLNGTKGNSVSISKAIGSPTGVTINSVTDKTARVSWTNAPFAQSAEIEFPSGTVIPVSGNNFEFINLTASTSYSFAVRNKFGAQVSSWVNQGFATKQSGIASPSQTVLAGSNAFVSQAAGKIFGFEILNDKYYVAYAVSTPSPVVVVKSYNAAGVELNSYQTPAWFGAPFKRFDMCVSSDSVYITYPDDPTTVQEVQVLNENLSPGTEFVTGPTPLSGVDSAKLGFHGTGANRKLFLSTSNALNLNLLALAPDLSSYNVVMTSTLYSSPVAYGLQTCADEQTGELFYAMQANMTSNIEIYKKSLSNIMGTSTYLGYIPPNGDFKSITMAGKDLLVSFSGSTNSANYLFNQSGFYSSLSADTMLSSVGVDARNRIWAFNWFGGSRFLVNVDSGRVVNSIAINQLPNYDPSNNNLVDPWEFIKQGRGTGNKFGMLYLNSSNDLVVVNYDSSF